MKIEGAENQVKRWLSNYSTMMDDITEDEEIICVEDEEGGEPKLMVNHTGTYSEKMVLNRPIPQLLAMGRKIIKIYYRGKDVYQWNKCDSMDEFMLNHDFGDDMCKSWFKQIGDWRVRVSY